MAYSWRWTQWVILLFTVVCVTPTVFMKETYKSVILRRRNKKRGYRVPDLVKEQPFQFARRFVTSTVTRPVHMFCVEPVVASFTSYVAINFGMLYSFFAAFPYVFETQYNFNLGQVGLTFLGLGVGVAIGCALIIVLARTFYQRQKAKASDGKVPPEARLYIAMIGSILLPVSLFWFDDGSQSYKEVVAPLLGRCNKRTVRWHIISESSCCAAVRLKSAGQRPIALHRATPAILTCKRLSFSDLTEPCCMAC